MWRYVYRAIDQHGQVIDVLMSKRRDGEAARQFFRRALSTLKVTPTEVVTDAAPVCPRVLDEPVPAAWHHVERYANNRIEADHGRLKHRLRLMRGLRTDRAAQIVISGLAFVQNVRLGHLNRHRESAPAATRRGVHGAGIGDLKGRLHRVDHVRRRTMQQHPGKVPLTS
jgi:transposase-like protein